MPEMPDTDILDLVATTQRKLGRGKVSQIAQNLQRYEVMPKWFKRDRVLIDDGIGIQRTVMTRLLNLINIPWRHVTTNYGYERRELLMNRGESRIVNEVKMRKEGAMLDLFEQMEDKAWSCPVAADVVDPYGVPYYVVKNAAEGFNGGNPSDHTAVAGLNSDAYANWKNYTYTYTEFTQADLVLKMRRSHRRIGWKSPITVQEFRQEGYKQLRLYMTETVLENLENRARDQNDNLGPDFAELDGSAVFKKHSLVWVPQLDADTTNPIYFIDHSSFRPVILRGDFMHETTPKFLDMQHNTIVVYMDMSFNFFCEDRRRNAVGYYVAA